MTYKEIAEWLAITLTDGLDTGAAFTGTSGNDTFVATDETFTTGDSLNGGAGTDTLSVVFGDASLTPVVDTAAIEKISLRNTEGAQALTLDASGWEGVTTLESLRSNDDVILTGVQANAALSMNRMATGVDFDVTFADDAVASATATLSVAADDSDANLIVTTGGDDVFTTLNVAAASDSVIALTLADDAGNDDTLTTINVTGAGALELTEAAAEFEQVTTITVGDGGLTIDTDGNAENVTVTAGNGENDLTIDGGGDITITAGNGGNTIIVGGGDDDITTGSGVDTITIDGGNDTVNSGDGNDVITVAANLTADDSINFGAGTADTLVADDASLATIAADEDILAAVSNYERIRVSDNLATDLDASDFGVNYVQLVDDVSDGAGATEFAITGLTSGATIELRDFDDMTDTLTVGITGAQAGGTPNDTLNLKFNANLSGAGAPDSIEYNFDVAGINKINVSATDRDNTDDATDVDDGYVLDLDGTVSGLDANVNTITITGDRALSYTSSATANSLSTIDGSAATGELSIDVDLFAGTEGVIIKGGAANDTIEGSDLADVITGDDGDDSIEGGTGADELAGGAGADTFVFAAGDSDTTDIDVITGFTAAEVTADDGDTLDITATAVTADDDGIDVSAAEAGGGAGMTIDAEAVDGIITLSGADANEINTLAEWLGVVEAYVSAAQSGANAEVAAAFEFNGSTYVVDASWTDGTTTYAVDAVIQLENVVDIVGVSATDAANTIHIA